MGRKEKTEEDLSKHVIQHASYIFLLFPTTENAERRFSLEHMLRHFLLGV